MVLVSAILKADWNVAVPMWIDWSRTSIGDLNFLPELCVKPIRVDVVSN
jgi:cytochrome c oxidase subunit IV